MRKCHGRRIIPQIRLFYLWEEGAAGNYVLLKTPLEVATALDEWLEAVPPKERARFLHVYLADAQLAAVFGIISLLKEEFGDNLLWLDSYVRRFLYQNGIIAL